MTEVLYVLDLQRINIIYISIRIYQQIRSGNWGFYYYLHLYTVLIVVTDESFFFYLHISTYLGFRIDQIPLISSNLIRSLPSPLRNRMFI